jgi:hypothetical protein
LNLPLTYKSPSMTPGLWILISVFIGGLIVIDSLLPAPIPDADRVIHYPTAG